MACDALVGGAVGALDSCVGATGVVASLAVCANAPTGLVAMTAAKSGVSPGADNGRRFFIRWLLEILAVTRRVQFFDCRLIHQR